MLQPVTDALTPEAARQIAEAQLDPETQARIDELAAKADSGELSEEERAEYAPFLDGIDLWRQLACNRCNSHKGTNLSSIDPETEKKVDLFDPRRDTWEEHFTFDGPRIVGRTAKGRATLHLLQMNAPYRVELREWLIEEVTQASPSGYPARTLDWDALARRARPHVTGLIGRCGEPLLAFHRKRKRPPKTVRVSERKVKVREPGSRKKKPAKRKKKPVRKNPKTDFVPMEGKTATLIPRNKQDSLLAFYSETEAVTVGHEVKTIGAMAF
jgi:hypothetical protein